MKMIEHLTEEYQRWNAEQGLNLGSADEHLNDDDLTSDQLEWLRRFCECWDLAQEFVNATFMDLFEAHRDLKARGPNECDGYSDKGYYLRLAALREAIDTYFVKA